MVGYLFSVVCNSEVQLVSCVNNVPVLKNFLGYQLCHLSLVIPVLSLAIPGLSLAIPGLSLAIPGLSLLVPSQSQDVPGYSYPSPLSSLICPLSVFFFFNLSANKFFTCL